MKLSVVEMEVLCILKAWILISLVLEVEELPHMSAHDLIYQIFIWLVIPYPALSKHLAKLLAIMRIQGYDRFIQCKIAS